jgi:anoctamin-10
VLRVTNHPDVSVQAFISWFGALTNSALVYLFSPQDNGPFTARLGTTADAAGQSGLSTTWHVLMVPALLIALSSSHAYLLARTAMRHLIHRAIWKSSDEERLLQKAQDEVKSFYLNAIRADEEMSELAIAQLTQGSQATSGETAFWDQDDGLEELRQASKTT